MSRPLFPANWPKQPDSDSLDAAWKRAEAALPLGWWFRVSRRADGSVSAIAVTPQNRWDWMGEGDTPAAALNALAERLSRAD